MSQSHFDALGNKLQESKDFLKSIHDSDGKTTRLRAILQRASSKELNLLVTILFHVCNGDIQLKRSTYDRVTKSKKRPTICRHFERERDVAELKRKGRGDILDILFKIQSVLPALLTPLFK